MQTQPNSEAQHFLHIYTGEGKGKTTAAMGLALRMLGHGGRVLVVQFMKQGDSGELLALRGLPGAIIHPGAKMEQFTYQMTPAQLEETKARQSAELSKIADLIAREEPALTVLDELAVAMAYQLVPTDEALRIIDLALRHGDAVVTGRGASDELIARADYVSRIEAVKHPYDEGISARLGIEW